MIFALKIKKQSVTKKRRKITMLYFVRHGATDWNEYKNEFGEKDAKCQGRADIELNEMGKIQAQATAKFLKNVKIDRIICSPLTRAKQTCEIINFNNLPVEYDNRLIERDFGEYEGVNVSKFDFNAFWNGKNELFGNRAETIDELRTRVYNFLIELEDYPNDKNVLVVSHGGVGLIVTEYFKGKPKNYNYLEYIIPNGKPLIFDFQKP